jgi:hypothetical protein
MTINRRNFVQGATCLAAAPTFANFLFHSSSEQSNTAVADERTPARYAAEQTTANIPLFKIHGWECDRDIGTDEAQATTHISDAVNDDRAVIRVMQSWRTAWR